MPHSINPATGKQRRGFAGMSLERRREISRMGGAAVPASKRSFALDADLAARAGAAGGHAAGGRRKGR